jgi:uncharacterized protein (DUF58 family)
MAVETSGLLEPRELRTLENLRLRPNRTYRGSSKGERISRQKGVSIEFADFRNYSEGDDLRHLDWNVLARLDTPVMRTYQDEEDVVLYVCLDCSPSMNFGEPTKLHIAQKYAMAFGYVGLVGGDGVRLKVLGSKQPPTGIMRGRSSAYRFMDAIQRNGEEQNLEKLTESLRSLVRSNLRSGILVLISDGLDPELPGVIRALGGRGFEVWHAQILSDIEIDPDLEGDLRLIDSEGSSPTEITINRETLSHYRKSLEAHIVAVSEAAMRTGGHHQLIRTSDSLEEVMVRKLKPGGWLE